MTEPLSKLYDPTAIERDIYENWQAQGHFRGNPEDEREAYTIVIPPPNVTGALHLGHAINNTLQDVLIRWQRMQGRNTLWLPGTDHAGIATQAVVEKRLLEVEGKTRHDVGRQGLVDRIWQWKEQYGARIIDQLKLLGCSCDWEQTRFTLDDMCARAVRHTFFRMFERGLVYRGKRLVNWDTHLETAISDDEVYHEAVNGYYWYIRYPLIDRRAGEPEHLVVATSRPETMLGDTAVAVNPQDPRWSSLIGRRVMLPLLARELPIIADDWADPEKGSGCVKITPAHDPNDYEVGLRHPEIGAINILRPNGTLNEEAGPYVNLTVPVARKRVVADLEAQGLIERIEEQVIDIGHSDRSKTAIEPFLSEQWFLSMDQPVTLADGRNVSGLAQAAMDAVADGQVRLHPARYAKMYQDWLSEKRDWPVSRQLWWGHRIPIWYCPAAVTEETLQAALGDIEGVAWRRDPDTGEWWICSRDTDLFSDAVPGATLRWEEDVLDTWFSSGLWPHSTLGWPLDTPHMRRYFPTNVLVTSRDIITLWVARMVMMTLFNTGRVPFDDVYVHVKILDGRGVTMSKSKGNGVDPVDIVGEYGTDSLRYTMVDMSTETQDMRLPVDYKCTGCSRLIPQTEVVPEGKQPITVHRVRCRHCGVEFATQWASPALKESLPVARETSDKFEIGQKFCNKLWNSARFVLMNLEGTAFRPLDPAALPIEDRWILSRTAAIIASTHEGLGRFDFSNTLARLREFFWTELCDWYVELVKPRLKAGGDDAADARSVLATVLDVTLRLLHPVVPFITEALWHKLAEIVPQRGVEQPLPTAADLIVSPWPALQPGWVDAEAEQTMGLLQAIVRSIRDVRHQYQQPRASLDLLIRTDGPLAADIEANSHVIRGLGGVAELLIDAAAERPKDAATIVIVGFSVYVRGVIDVDKERTRLEKSIAETSRFLDGLRRKLSSEGFLTKAKPEIVEKERGRLAEAEEKLATLQDNLAAL